MNNVRKTEAFLREQFANCAYFTEHPADGEYRLQHSYRVANVAGEIARKEGLDEEGLIIGGLLHDVGYCLPLEGEEGSWGNWQEHGRLAARLVRPFLEQLDLGRERVQEICYGIAIHADGRADFPGEKTAFARSIGDADDVDRFDAYRIYDAMEYADFRSLKIGGEAQVASGEAGLDRAQAERKARHGNCQADDRRAIAVPAAILRAGAGTAGTQ